MWTTNINDTADAFLNILLKFYQWSPGIFEAQASQNRLVMQELCKPCIDLYYVRTIRILHGCSSGRFSLQSVFQDKRQGGRVRKYFSTERVLIKTKYLSYCWVSWCHASVIISIHYDRNSKNPSFHLVINVPIWRISPLYLPSLQGCHHSCFYFEMHTNTYSGSPSHFSNSWKL